MMRSRVWANTARRGYTCDNLYAFGSVGSQGLRVHYENGKGASISIRDVVQFTYVVGILANMLEEA